MKFFRNSFFILALLLARESFAQWPAQLVNNPSRPTVAEVKKAFSNWPEESPGTKAKIDIDAKIAAYAPLAEAIVNFEAAFQGGTYAFLGRDSAVVADAFDAFYQAIGQKGRVVLLNASTESFSGSNDDIINEFLESNGLNFRAPLEKPFVMADTTSYSIRRQSGGQMSQSRRLLSAAYRKLTGNGFKARDLIRKVNFVSFTRGVPLTLSEHYFDGTTVDNNGPHAILNIPPGLETYTTVWHDAFLPFQRSGGKMFAPPGRKHVNAPDVILEHMYETITVVSSPEFIKEVMKLARQKKVYIQFEETVFQKALIAGVKLRDLLVKLKGEGKLEEETKTRMWPIGDYAVQFLEILPELQNKGFDVRELRRMAKILIFDPELYATFLDNVKVNSKADYLELTSPLAKDIEDPYRFVLDDFILKSLPNFKKLGATVEDVLALESRSLKRRRNKVKLWNQAIELYTSPKDALVLFRSAKEDMGGEYRAAKEKFIVETLKKQASSGNYPWTLEETIEIQQLLWLKETTLEFLDVVLNNVSTIAEYEAVMKYYVSPNRYDLRFKAEILEKVFPFVESEILRKNLVGPGLESFVRTFGNYSNIRMNFLRESKTADEFFTNVRRLNDLNAFPHFKYQTLIEIMEFFVQFNPSQVEVEEFNRLIIEHSFAHHIDKKRVAMDMLTLHTSRKTPVLAPFYQTSELAIEWTRAFFQNHLAWNDREGVALISMLIAHRFSVAQLNEILAISSNYPGWSYNFLRAALPNVADPANLKLLKTKSLRVEQRLMTWYRARSLRVSAPKPIQCSTLLGF